MGVKDILQRAFSGEQLKEEDVKVKARLFFPLPCHLLRCRPLSKLK